MENCEEALHGPFQQAFLDQCRYEYDEDFGGCMMEVPLMRRNMDYIRLWIKPKEGGDDNKKYIITDAGKTYASFYTANLNLDTDRRKRMITAVKNRYNLDRAKYEVRIIANEMNLGERLLDAVQAVQSLSHLTITRQPRSQSSFQEDVYQYISEHELGVVEDITVRGSSQKWNVDMEVTNGHKSYVKTLHSTSKSYANDRAKVDAYMWVELNDIGDDVEFVSVVDDVDGVIGEDSLRTLRSRADSVVPWSEREHLIGELTAQV